jgi:hypothetical protein
MRHAIDWWMFVAVREDPWSKAIYDDCRIRGHGHNRGLHGLGGPLDAHPLALLDRPPPYNPDRRHPNTVTIDS